jgi:hypothetical protein
LLIGAAMALTTSTHLVEHDECVSGPQDLTSPVEAALSYVQETAPTDVLETVAWLQSTGWQVEEVQGGRGESFGNVLVDFEKGQTRIRLVRDRGQWLLTIRPADWSETYDFQVIAQALTGMTLDKLSERSGTSLPEMVPTNVIWVETLPAALDWLSMTPGAESQLQELRRQRSRSLWH